MHDAMTPTVKTGLDYHFDELFLRDEGEGRHICLNQVSGSLVVINDTAAALVAAMRSGVPAHVPGDVDPDADLNAKVLFELLEGRQVLRKRLSR